MAKKLVGKPGSLILVHFVEQQLEGWTFARDHWPLHITLVPWFTVEDEEAVERSLERVANASGPLTLAVGKQDNFGVDHDVPVNIIANQEPALELHQKLVQALGEADTAYHEQRFMGHEYVAHITRHDVDNRHSNEGEDIMVNNFHLVRLLEGNQCRVEQQFDLR